MVTRTFSQSIREAEAGGSLEIELQSEFQNSKGYIKNPYLKKREAVKKRKMRDSLPLPPLPSPCVYVCTCMTGGQVYGFVHGLGKNQLEFMDKHCRTWKHFDITESRQSQE